MIPVLVVIAVALGIFLAGFGLGRVKNAAKLKAARVALNKLELGVGSEAKSVIAAIRAHL